MANCLYRGESYVRRPCLSRRTNSVAKANRRRMWCSFTLLTSYKSLLQTKIVRFFMAANQNIPVTVHQAEMCVTCKLLLLLSVVGYLVRYINLTFRLVEIWTHQCQAADTNRTDMFLTEMYVCCTQPVQWQRVQCNISTSDRPCSCCCYQTGIQLGLMKNSHNHFIKNSRLNLNGCQN